MKWALNKFLDAIKTVYGGARPTGLMPKNDAYVSITTSTPTQCY